MRILYGVQGTGNGHITRARAMARELAKLDVKVDYLFSGRAPGKFFDMEVFGDYQVREGVTFNARDGRVRPLATVAATKPWQFFKDLRELDLRPYDLVVTDFEPLTAWAAKLAKKKSIGLGHQYAFHHDIPQHRGSPLQRAILLYFAPASIVFGLHWHHFGQPILPPIAPVEPGIEPPLQNSCLVYLPFESKDRIRALLQRFPAYQFNVYHPESLPGREGHIHWHLPSRSGFQRDLQRTEGVICNAGFELSSEVLQLGRKLLVKPVRGQSEQYSNALALNLLGYGHVMRSLDADAVRRWLESAKATRIRYPNVAEAVARWLVGGAEEPTRCLVESLWAATELPQGTAASRLEYSEGSLSDR